MHRTRVLATVFWVLGLASLFVFPTRAEEEDHAFIVMVGTMTRHRKHGADYGGWSPARFTVRKGTRVTLRITAMDYRHLLEFSDLEIASPEIPKGKTVEFTFVPAKQGTFEYRCRYHVSMTGEMTVLPAK